MTQLDWPWPYASVSEHSVQRQYELSDNFCESSNESFTVPSNENLNESSNDSFTLPSAEHLIESSDNSLNISSSQNLDTSNENFRIGSETQGKAIFLDIIRS